MMNESLLHRCSVVDWAYCTDDLASSYEHYQQWLAQGLHSNLNYLTGERAKQRRSLRAFYPEFKSAVVFLFSYAQVAKFLQEFYRTAQSNGLKVASFVLAFQGIDYHHYLKEQLRLIGNDLVGEGNFVIGLDVHPVLERDLAVRSGLGWFGKNSMFISLHYGSFVILGSLFFNRLLDLPSKNRIADHCGQCHACIDACPTQAITNERTIDAGRCISNFTIEQFKEVAAPAGMELATGEIFGCDICQNVCPWNKKYLAQVESSSPPLSAPLDELLSKDIYWLIAKFEQMSNRQFRRLFKGTSLERTGRVGLLKNLKFWLNSFPT